MEKYVNRWGFHDLTQLTGQVKLINEVSVNLFSKQFSFRGFEKLNEIMIEIKIKIRGD